MDDERREPSRHIDVSSHDDHHVEIDAGGDVAHGDGARIDKRRGCLFVEARAVSWPGQLWNTPAARSRALLILGLVIGLLALATLALGLFWYRSSLDPGPTPSNRIVVLVAEFSENASPEPPENRTVSQIVLRSVQEVGDADPRVDVVHPRIVILDKDTAEARAKDYRATIVIYGWYSRSGTHALLDAGFEVPGRRPRYLPATATGEITKTVTLEEMNAFGPVFALAKELKSITSFTVGLIYYDEQAYEPAIARFTEALSYTVLGGQRVGKADILLYRGNAYVAQSDPDPDRAITDYNMAIYYSLQPNAAEAYYGLGNAYAEKGDYEQAIENYGKAIDRRPAFPEAYYGRGKARVALDNYDQAIKDYDEAIRLQPRFPEAYYGRGIVYKIKGEKDKAIADFRRFLDQSPDPDWRAKAWEHLHELGED